MAAFPRVYSVSAIQVAVPTKDPDGADWDFGAGAPDLFVEITVGSSLVATTPAVADTFMASFAGPYDASLIAGSGLHLVAYDEDVTVNDLAYGCSANPITAAHLRQRSLSCTSATSSLRFTIRPK